MNAFIVFLAILGLAILSGFYFFAGILVLIVLLILTITLKKALRWADMARLTITLTLAFLSVVLALSIGEIWQGIKITFPAESQMKEIMPYMVGIYFSIFFFCISLAAYKKKGFSNLSPTNKGGLIHELILNILLTIVSTCLFAIIFGLNGGFIYGSLLGLFIGIIYALVYGLACGWEEEFKKIDKAESIT